MGIKLVAFFVIVAGLIFGAILLGPKVAQDNKEESSVPDLNTESTFMTVAPAPTKTQNIQVKNLVIEDIQIGSGSAEVKSGDKISIHYTGRLTDGKVFDSSVERGQPFETQIGVGQVIEGWDRGVIGMKVGGQRRLTIPPDLGYGQRGAGPIPPNSVLIFDVQLMGIE